MKLILKFRLILLLLSVLYYCKAQTPQQNNRARSSFVRSNKAQNTSTSKNEGSLFNNPLDQNNIENLPVSDTRGGNIYERINEQDESTFSSTEDPVINKDSEYGTGATRDKCDKKNRKKSDPYRYDLCNKDTDFLDKEEKKTLEIIFTKIIEPKLSETCSCEKTLEIIKDLKTVDLSSSNIIDVAPAVVFTETLYLNLKNNKIKNLSYLNSLTNLTALNLSENNLYDIDSIENLDKLNQLDVSQNNLSGISIVMSLDKLKYININDNPKIKNISAIYDYYRTNFKNLSIKHNNKDMQVKLEQIMQQAPSCPDDQGLDLKGFVCKALTESVIGDFL